MAKTIAFTVHGVAQPAGSKKGFPIKRANGKMGVVITDGNPKSKGWMNIISMCAAETMQRNSHEMIRDAVELTMKFFLPRPKSHYRTGKNSHLLKDDAPKRPITKPDDDKLGRRTRDGLSKIVFLDDSLVVDSHVHKFYGEPARAEITIAEIEP